MKKLNRWMSMVLTFIMVVGIVGVIGVNEVDASEPSFSVISVNSSKSTLEKGDSFGLFVEVSGYSDLKFDYADFSGESSVDTGTATGKVLLAETPTGDGSRGDIYIGGLTFLGGDGNLNFTIVAKDENDKQATRSVNIKLNVEIVSDGKGSLQLKDSSQVSVVAGETKKVEMLVYNSGTSTVRNPLVNVTVVDDKSDGITIKGGKSINISSISPKSSSRVSFEVETSKAVKAGNYKLQVDLAGNVETISLRVTSDLMPPQLQFTIDGTSELKAGSNQPLKIKVTNVGDSEAKEIKVELEYKDDLAIVGGSNVKYISKIGVKQSAYIDYNVNISPTVKQNILPVKVSYTYKDEIGQPNQDKEQYIYIPLQGGLAANGEVVVQNIISPAGTLDVDKSFNVKFTVASLQGDAKNVKIQVAAEDVAGIVPRSQNLFMVPTLKKGEAKQYSVTMSATSKAGSHSHPIKIQVEYDSIRGDEKIEFTQYTSVNIFNPKAEEDDETENKKGQPKVIVGEYKVSPTVVQAGKEFELEIGFLNTNKVKSVSNLKANLTVREQGENDAGNVFTPVNASNTFYISDLSPGEMVTKKITMYTIPNAKPKTYQVQLDLEYEDDKGNEVKAVESIGIPVEQITKIDITEIQVDYMTVGMPMPINVNLYNTGKTDISNVMIYTEGEGFSVQDNKMFIGNFEKGASDYYTPTLIPEQPGTLTGTVVVEYEEATGEISQIRKDFEMEVMGMPDPETPDGEFDIPPHEEGGKGKGVLIGGIIAGIAAASVITFIVIKKRKKAKEIEFDLDE